MKLKFNLRFCAQATEASQPPKTAHSSIIARPKRRDPPTVIQDLRGYPEIIPVQEVILEESAEEECSPPHSEEKG